MNTLVLCEVENGAFKKTAGELLGKAKELGGTVTALVLGDASDPASLGAFGADKVLHVTGEAFASYNSGATVRAVQEAIGQASPTAVIAPASPSMKDAMPRLAARLGLGLASECTDLKGSGESVVGRRPLYAGKAFADVQVKSTPALFTVRPNSFGAPAGGGSAAEVTALSVSLQDGDTRTQVVGHEEPSSKKVDLTEANRIVSGGRSLKSEENFNSVIRPLADALGATAGASRAAVDAGYAPHSDQVGQTGKTVNPSLYIACGISGMIQHLAGMRTSKVIVAVNTDPAAPIFEHATYGIVGDLFEICPLLTEEFKAALS